MQDVAPKENHAGIGDNLPPEDADPLRDRLYEDHSDLIKRRDELLAGMKKTPAVIEDGDEQTAGDMADFIQRQVNDFIKSAKAVHVNEKAPFLAASRTCDNFKNMLIDEIEKGKAKVNAVRKAFADRKAAAERIRREEAERVAREEAREAQRKADEEAAKRRAEAAEAQRVADEAAAAERKKAAEAQRVADEAAKKLADEEEYQGALEAQREADRIAAESAARATLAQKEADRVTKANTAKDKLAQKEADRVERVAIKAGRGADAKSAELGKSRGEYGGQTSLKEFWDFADLDRATLDLDALRDHLPHDALEKGIRSWIKANVDALRQGATLNGVRIFEDTRL